MLGTLRRLGLERLLTAQRSRQRDLVVALVVERLLAPCSKLATARLWSHSTLARNWGSKTPTRTTSTKRWTGWGRASAASKPSWPSGISQKVPRCSTTSPAATTRGATVRWRPLATAARARKASRSSSTACCRTAPDGPWVDVYPGNTADPTTLPDQVAKLRHRFGLSRVVLVGDRGLLTQTQIDQLRQHPGLGWISALRSGSIRELVAGGYLQLSLFDEQNLAEIRSPDYPGERLIACYNPLLADQRRRKREELLAATEKELERVAAEVKRRTRTPLTADQIGLKVGRVLNRYKVGKHFATEMGDGVFAWSRREESIQREADLTVCM